MQSWPDGSVRGTGAPLPGSRKHQGEVCAIPGPLEDGLLLVSKPKGIYKPADLPYALSIRINLGSPYADDLPVPTPGDGWLLSYHQEGPDPARRDTMFTNRGLMQCIAGRIPVGVLRERAPASRRSQYDVFGLAPAGAMVRRVLLLREHQSPAVPVLDPVSDVLAATARAELDQEEQAGSADLDGYDARLRVYRQIVARQGQPGFRSALLAAYQGRCAVTGCDAVPPWKALTCTPTAAPNPTPS